MNDRGSTTELFCPRLETERQEGRKTNFPGVLKDFGCPYQEAEVTGKRAKFLFSNMRHLKTPAIAERIVKELASKSLNSFVD